MPKRRCSIREIFRSASPLWKIVSGPMIYNIQPPRSIKQSILSNQVLARSFLHITRDSWLTIYILYFIYYEREREKKYPSKSGETKVWKNKDLVLERKDVGRHFRNGRPWRIVERKTCADPERDVKNGAHALC